MYKKYYKLKTPPNKTISIVELLKLSKDNRDLLKDIEFLPPRLGDQDFGKVVITQGNR